MAQLRQEKEKLTEMNIEVLVIGPEKKEAFTKYWESEGLDFVGLPDPDHTVAKLYGQEVKILKLGRMPAQLLVDTSGIIKHAHYGDSMSDIPKLDAIQDVLSSVSHS